MREYETVYVLRPDLEDQVAMDFIMKMKGILEKTGGQHIKLSNWGRKKLAWERDRQQKGMFVQHQYLGNPGVVKEYERFLGIEESVMLRQTVVVARNVPPGSRPAQEDQIVPPVVKERREERERDDYQGSSRDRDDDMGGRGGRGHRDADDGDMDDMDD